MPDKHSLESRIWTVVLAGTLGACGTAQAPPAEAPPPESAPVATSSACSLLTAAEIQEVLGRAPGAPITPPGAEDCVYPDASDSTLTILRVSLADSGYSSYDSFVATYQAEFGGEEPPREYYRPVEGIGDWAMYVADENALQVFRGGKMLQVSPNPPDEGKALGLAHKAIARLP
jgi:hypothetical protein